MRKITVKGVTLGEGPPKICVPLIGASISELVEEAKAVQEVEFDLVEWRVDFFEQVEELEAVKGALAAIREILAEVPLIFTFRSRKEGGEKEIRSSFYQTLNQTMIETKQVDFIDIELFSNENVVTELIESAHKNRVYTIVSNHDFEKTPNKEEIISRLQKAQDLGADLPKIAVMPQNPLDVLTLLEATYEMSQKFAKTPIITMSMAGDGIISRFSGEIFGSAITFGAVKKASAPGQVNAIELRRILSLLHQNR